MALDQAFIDAEPALVDCQAGKSRDLIGMLEIGMEDKTRPGRDIVR